ncbi:MAG: Gfo/Idh/MocA family oxidoreductase [Fimbriimonadaceae bacterium]|nr:Gfo/Idh/MocA family oxidoreductase [Fimbriimonadaceae bacterium]
MLIRFGVVGCGAIHGTHCDAIGKIAGATLAGVYDVVPERSGAAGEKFGVKAHRSFGSLLNAVDAVCVCVPSGLHAQLALKAVRAGKHVVVEKPVDVKVAPATKLVRAARDAGVKLTVISQHRFAADIRRVRDAVQSGELGRPLIGDSFTKWYRTQAYYDSGAWRGTWKLDGGSLMNQSVHYIDMIQWIMGGVAAVRAIMRTAAHDIEAEDVAYALVEYRNGAIGVIHGATVAYPGFAERLEVSGTYGSMIVEGDRLKFCELDPNAPSDPSPYGKGVQKQPTPKVTSQDDGPPVLGGANDPTAIWGEQHRLQIEDFVRAIHDDRDPFITGEDALEPLKVLEAIYRSGRNGGKKVTIAS